MRHNYEWIAIHLINLTPMKVWFVKFLPRIAQWAIDDGLGFIAYNRPGNTASKKNYGRMIRSALELHSNRGNFSHGLNRMAFVARPPLTRFSWEYYGRVSVMAEKYLFNMENDKF